MIKFIAYFLFLILLIHFGDSFIQLPKTSFSFQKSTKELSPLSRSKSYKINTKLFGIPKLFRWLVDLYPSVVNSANLENSKGKEIDNFYLDMNGIIHACTHANSKDKLVLTSEKEMFSKIFSYTDHLYKLLKPKRLLYLAVDGVAPRAKMNQQRSRRFKSAKERESLIAEYIAEYNELPKEDSFDSNCITPGTDFMFRLDIAFKDWIQYKMRTDNFWKNGAEVIFSGADVPGEGEHKIMDKIRYDQETIPNYRESHFKHCMFGLDADLIMLSLVTHEPYFVLLREKLKRGGRYAANDLLQTSLQNFEILDISVLRIVINEHFKNIPIPADETNPMNQLNSNTDQFLPKYNTKHLERLIDDFVFMCFLVGNDFLPCLPHLDIGDGALHLMMNIYHELFPKFGGYLTNKNKIHLPRLELFIQEIARREPLYFSQRSIDEEVPEYSTNDYKEYYYQTKHSISSKDIKSIRPIIKSYIEGLIWVLTYYHYGCQSWNWYYPYLYNALASDFIDLADNADIEFLQGQPFTPLLQLLSVLPPQSSNFLPKPYSDLMTNPKSPLTVFYPSDFTVDQNGKKQSWESIANIPFIDEKQLLQSINSIDHKKELNEAEQQRNLKGTHHIFKPQNK